MCFFKQLWGSIAHSREWPPQCTHLLENNTASYVGRKRKTELELIRVKCTYTKRTLGPHYIESKLIKKIGHPFFLLGINFASGTLWKLYAGILALLAFEVNVLPSTRFFLFGLSIHSGRTRFLLFDRTLRPRRPLLLPLFEL